MATYVAVFVKALQKSLAEYDAEAEWKQKYEALPQAPRLERYAFPELFDRLDNLCDSAGVPRLNLVYASLDVNAVIYVHTEYPHSPNESALVIGMPFLLGLSRSDLDAVLVHEVAHMQDSAIAASQYLHYEQHRLGRIIWRLERRPWRKNSKMLARLERNLKLDYHALSELYSSTSMQSEFYADEVGAQLTSKTQYVRSDLAIAVLTARHFNRFDSWLRNAVRTSMELPAHAYRQYISSLQGILEPDECLRLQNTLQHATGGTLDTHPLQRDRLQKNGWDGEFPSDLGILTDPYYAIDNPVLEEALTMSNEIWSKWIETSWDEARKEYEEAVEHLEKLQTEQPDVTDEEISQRIRSLLVVGRFDESLRLSDDYATRITSDDFQSSRAFLLTQAKRFNEAKPVCVHLAENAATCIEREREFNRLVYIQYSGNDADYPYLIAMRDKVHEVRKSHDFSINTIDINVEWLELDFDDKTTTRLRNIISQQPSLRHVWVAQRMAGLYPPFRQTVLICKPTLMSTVKDAIAALHEDIADFPHPVIIYVEQDLPRVITRKLEDVYHKPCPVGSGVTLYSLY